MKKSMYISIFGETSGNFLNSELDFIFIRVNERVIYAPLVGYIILKLDCI